jgi:hypothetical protein
MDLGLPARFGAYFRGPVTTGQSSFAVGMSRLGCCAEFLPPQQAYPELPDLRT